MQNQDESEKIGLELIDDVSQKHYSYSNHISINCNSIIHYEKFCPKCGAYLISLSQYIKFYGDISIGNKADQDGNFEFCINIPDQFAKSIIYGPSIKEAKVYSRIFSNIRVTVKGKYNKKEGLITELTSKIDSYKESMSVLTIDLAKNPKVFITKDGTKVKSTDKNIREICSNAIVNNQGEEIAENLIDRAMDILNTSSIYKTIKFLFDYPATESILIADGFRKYAKGFFDKRHSKPLKKHVNTPAEMLGIHNRVYQTICHSNTANCCFGLYQFARNNTKLDTNQLCNLLDQMIRFNDAGINAYADVAWFQTEGYNLDKLYEYVTEEVYIYQGIEQPWDAFQTLRDYVSMQKGMSADYERYPRSLKLNHDLAVKNYHVLLDEIKQKKFKDYVTSPEYKRLEWHTEQYSIITPEKPEDMVREGSSLNHCVKSYVEYVCNRTTRIYFLRKNTAPERSYITIQINQDNEIQQARGFGDRCPNKEEAALLIKWANAKQLNSRWVQYYAA